MSLRDHATHTVHNHRHHNAIKRKLKEKMCLSACFIIRSNLFVALDEKTNKYYRLNGIIALPINYIKYKSNFIKCH